MIRIKLWRDSKGYALEFEDSRVELTEWGMTEFIGQLEEIRAKYIGNDETLSTEFCLDLEDIDDDGE